MKYIVMISTIKNGVFCEKICETEKEAEEYILSYILQDDELHIFFLKGKSNLDIVFTKAQTR